MKIRIESDKLVKAVKKLDGIEVVLENAVDAKEALDLILRKTGLLERPEYRKVKELKLTSTQRYETSAVDYKLIFLLEFVFEDGVTLDERVTVIKEVQEFFQRL